MKKILFISVMLLSKFGFSQSATIVNDTAIYNGKHYAVGDTLTTFYGSGANKNFAFISYGNGMSGIDPAASSFSKKTFIIDKVYVFQKKVFVRGKLLDGVNFGFKLFIDLEGAVDMKELKE
jgi:hypothetical protein